MGFFTAEEVERLASKEIRMAPLVKMEFEGDTAYCWNGYTEITTGGNTYLPMYGAASINGLGFSGGTASENVTVSLSGLPDEGLPVLAQALAASNSISQKMLTAYIQFFDVNWQPEGPPIGIFYGFMQPPQITRTAATETEGATQSISIVAENVLFNRSKPKNGRYTDQDQKRRSPTDRGFEFVKSLTFKNFTYPDF